MLYFRVSYLETIEQPSIGWIDSQTQRRLSQKVLRYPHDECAVLFLEYPPASYPSVDTQAPIFLSASFASNLDRWPDVHDNDGIEAGDRFKDARRIDLKTYVYFAQIHAVSVSHMP
jgi:hypothetical protein